MSSGRAIRSISMNPGTFQAVIETADRMKISQTLLISSVLDWYVEQDQSVQALVAGTLPEEFKQLVADRLAKSLIAKTKPAKKKST